MIKKFNNKVEYISIPKADHSFSSNRKTGSGKAFNGCSKMMQSDIDVTKKLSAR